MEVHAPPSEAKTLVAEALQAHAIALRAYTARRVPGSELEDVLQSAAVRALENAASLRDAERVLPWLYRVHRNAAVDALRSRSRAVQREANEQNALDELPAAEAVAAPCACSVVQARALRPNYAAILARVDAEGQSLTDAASEMGITVNNATVRLHRARAALRAAMRAHCGVERAEDCDDCRCSYDGCCLA